MSNRRIAILCGGPFAFPALLKLSMERFLCGVVLASKQFELVGNIRAESEKNNYPFLHVQDKEEVGLLEDWIDQVKPDAVFSICFPYHLPQAVLKKIPDGFFNFHPGPLPAYRGPSPIFEVLRRGEKETAIAVHCMSAEYDSGNILFSEKVAISPTENYQSLTYKLSSRCGIAALNLAEMLTFGSAPLKGTAQDETSAAFYNFPTEKDLIIDWNTMEAAEILALIRACHAWTRGAITGFSDELLRIPAAELLSEQAAPHVLPGTIMKIDDDNSFKVACLHNRLIRVPVFSSDFGTFSPEYLSELGIKEGIRLCNHT